jgi:kelch-like protein 2/3
MQTARYGLGVGVINDVLYAVGGANKTVANVPHRVEAYDYTTNSWTTVAPMPTARLRLGVGVINGILYAVGGHGDVDPHLSTVESFDPR